jgi:hypothetical protein
MQEFINVMKKPGVKNCVRINSEIDIPEFLKDVIKIENDTLILDCIEGEERVPIGSVIAYEKLDSGKMNVWNKANWKETTKEVDGVFYEIPKVIKATPVLETLPIEIVNGLGKRLTVLQDGSFQIDTGWGLSTCAPGEGYFIIFGTKEDGSLDANFLKKETPSFKSYFVVDENGEIVETLEEYDSKNINKAIA